MNYINMSNEEAIEMIDTILEVASNRECNDIEIDAFMERALEIAKQALANPTISYSTSMNIEALEQEPCENCISRQAALDLCERFDGCVPYSVLSSYDMLPPVTVKPKTEWIPITTPPTRNDRYLVTRKCLGKIFVDIVSYATNLYKINKYEFSDKKNKGGWWNSDPEYGSYEVDGITGWQELPESYKESEDKE